MIIVYLYISNKYLRGGERGKERREGKGEERGEMGEKVHTRWERKTFIVGTGGIVEGEAMTYSRRVTARVVLSIVVDD